MLIESGASLIKQAGRLRGQGYPSRQEEWIQISGKAAEELWVESICAAEEG